MEFTRACQEYKRKNSVAQVGKKPRAAFGFSRRKFVAGLGVSVGSFLPNNLVGIFGSPRLAFLQRSKRPHEMPASADLLYPPVDLSYFETPIGQRV
jgi:hypothetical protein